jgi:hypothetical protein
MIFPKFPREPARARESSREPGRSISDANLIIRGREDIDIDIDKDKRRRKRKRRRRPPFSDKFIKKKYVEFKIRKERRVCWRGMKSSH